MKTDPPTDPISKMETDLERFTQLKEEIFYNKFEIINNRTANK
jgi:hypothetical protein